MFTDSETTQVVLQACGTRKWAGCLSPGYEPLPQDAEVIQAVAEDPYGISLAGFFDSKRLPAQVRMVPLAKEEGGPYSISSYDDVFEGKYAYAPYLHAYLNRFAGNR